MKKKNTLIIYAHPKSKGNCSYALQRTKEELKKQSMPFKVIDLYKERYDAVLKDEELYTSGNYKVDKKNKAYQEMIKKSDNLIFIYPNWWNCMPAILKGFIDRVFVSGFAFKYEKGLPKGLLKGKRAAVIISMGAPYIMFKTILGQRSAKIMTDDILRFCGIKSKEFIIDKAVKFDEKQEKKINKKIGHALVYLR